MVKRALDWFVGGTFTGVGFVVTFIILLAFWTFMSGLFDAWHYGLGIISCALVAYMSHDLLFENIRSKGRLREAGRFVKYLPWLFYQIYLANIYVVKLAFSPTMSKKIRPHVVKFPTFLKKDISIVTFANSITLTPGTITLLIEDGYFYVHALDEGVAESLPGDMEIRVGRIYGETK
jgi:multicomponent Na+:H+ antiporter subunit E